ncbi:amino acid adenylation domain-containing protein [Streptomyces sp. NPDC003077]|uniref:amino acid adenylation domain-containing protein n=1 Tax=Streptomyces sp. NPDC003077 TaxID=3154443 RepID=UPI0033B025A6
MKGKAVAVRRNFPLTSYQRDIWAAESQAPDDPQFNVVFKERITGRVDAAELHAALVTCLRRNDAFSLRVDERDGVPFQWYEDPADTDEWVERVDLVGAEDPRAACDAWHERSLAEPLPPRRARLFRAALLRESDDVLHVHVNAHHLIADAWALNQLSLQTWAEYRRRTAGQDSSDTPPPALSELVAADAAYRDSADRERDRAFFRRALETAVPALFRRDGTKLPEGAPRRARHSFTVDAADVKAIRADGSSPFAFVAAAFAAYFSRIHRSEELVLGVPFLNRHSDRERETVGQVANNLPLRVTVPADATLHQVAGEVRAATGALRAHERLALGDILRDRPADPSGRRQLFDVTLSYLRHPAPVLPAGVEREPSVLAPVHHQDALSVMIHAHDDDGDLRVDLDYARDVFDADLPIEATAAHLRALIRRAAERPEVPLGELSPLDDAERERLLDFGRGPDVPFAEDRTVHGLIEEQAARTPDRIAVTADDPAQALTYAALDARANQVARALRGHGVGPGDRVAVLMRRGPHLLPALLGVLKSGGAYVPVDPGYPAERIAFLLADSRAKVVLTDGDAPASPEADTPIPHLRTADLLTGPDGPVEPTAGPRDLAYVIYTSGSTGRPKGVMVEHRSVINRLAWMQRRYPVGEGDVLLQKTPISFDVSVWELFWWAIEGAGLALLPVGAEKDPRGLVRTLTERRVTTVHFVPSMLGPFLDLLEESPDLLPGLSSLRRVFCSGEALPAARAEQFHRVFAAQAEPPLLVNLYGPTEATVDVSYHDLPADGTRPVRRVPIGRPIDNTRLYVLDAHGTPQPAGVPGELCIGGVGVARGYLDRPELTAEKFTDDPFVPGGRLYRTGDLARWLADGEVEYLGRIDGQVKIRGNRVETGEVQNALASVDGVRDAVVVDAHAPERGTYLVGYYVADQEREHAHLRAALLETLPEFMVPAHFVRIERIPLTPNGKADRRALPAPSLPTADPARRTAPRNETEETLARIWAEVLGTGEPVGVHDDYYVLGGDSILMLRVRAAAERAGLRFELTDLMRHPTVAGLAEHTTAAHDAADPEPEPFALVSSVDRARLEGRADAYPLTRLQLGLLYHSRAQENSAVYHDVFQYSFAMEWDEPRFRRAFARLVARHPVLRSSFHLAGFSEPLQVVDAEVPLAFDVVDLRTADEAEARAEIRKHVDEHRYVRYEFDRAPLYFLRAHLCAETVELVLSFHHAILDGGSVANLVRELLQDYLHDLGQDIEAVPDLDLPSPAHHVVAERRALESEETRAFWRERLEGAPLPQLDAFTPHRAPGSEELLTRRVDLPGDLTEAVRDLARAHALPVKSVLFAAHCLTLRLFSGTADLTTGLVTHGRPEREGAERIAGLFLNTMPVRLDTAAGTWLDVVREAFRQERDSHPHRRYPLSSIQEDLGTTVLETAFNYIHFRQLSDVYRLPGVTSLGFHAWEETNFRLLVNAVTDPADDSVWLRMDFAGRTFTAEQADLYADAFTRVLDRVVSHPDEAPDFAFLAPEPAAALPAAAARPDVVRGVADRAAATPDATALVMGEDRWSYARLAQTSDRVAHALLGRGAAPGDRVGIAMDRSPEAIATLLGVLKAGAAAVPLDTAYPRERIRSMLEQAAPVTVVAHTAHADQLADGPNLLLAEDLFGPDATAPEAVPLPEISPDSIAYVLFTSGSTGAPKGVAMPHRSLANLIAWQNGIPSGVVGGNTVQYAPSSFDVSFQEVFSTLCGGGTLVLVGEDVRRDMPALLRLLDREGVERLFMPYVALQQFAEAADALGTVPRHLKALISSGEQLRVTDEIRRLCAALPGVILENQYGPTESHVVAFHTMSGDPAAFPALPPIGVPVARTRVHVLDERLRPVPPGVKGELYLEGDCLAEGYLGRPDLTGERFIRPAGEDGPRLYRTGDLGFALPGGGEVVCLGRSDSQVKVRGFRVEPAEVELAITRFAADHPGLTEAAVVARRREGNDSFLAAFLVGDPDTTDVAALGRQLRTVLPEYMVPSHYEWLPALPLTPSGKRNDAALRAAPLTTGASGDTTAPRDAYERTLVEMLSELLGLPTLGVHDNIFDVGGTSLTAMRLVVLIEQRYGVNVPMSEFVAAPTVAELAERLRSDRAEVAFDPLVPIRKDGDRRPLFFVHPMGGNVLCYVRFAKHLPPGRPFYAFQAAGVDPGTEPLRDVESIAAGYIATMKRVQPEGPYLIGGWSFGGFVAFEMARQLRAAGDEVGRLVLLDTTALNPGRRLRTNDDALLGWFFWELLWLHRGGDSPLEIIPAELTTLDEKFDFIARLAVDEGVLPAGSTGAVVRRLFHVYEANWRAAFAYRPEIVDQDMTLIKAEEPLPEVLDTMHSAIDSMHKDPANGWRQRTSGDLNLVVVPGDHLTIMEEPYVGHVVRVVSDLMGE